MRMIEAKVGVWVRAEAVGAVRVVDPRVESWALGVGVPPPNTFQVAMWPAPGWTLPMAGPSGTISLCDPMDFEGARRVLQHVINQINEGR